MRSLRRGAKPNDKSESPVQPAQEQGDPEPELSKGARRRTWAIRGIVALALILIGAGLTYLVAPPVGSAPKLVRAAPTAPDAAAKEQTAPMPALNGLSVDTARLVLRDAGASDPEVLTTTEAAAGPAGLILAQNPTAGSDIGSGEDLKVWLTLSKAIPVPDVKGTAFQRAQSQLQQLGAIVRAEQVIRPGSKAGTVLGSDPAPGATMPAVVTLDVADPGVSTPLGELTEEDSSDCSGTSEITVGNTVAPSAVACEIYEGQDQDAYIVYRLNQAPLALSFTAGRDRNYGAGSFTLRIVGDGTTLSEVQIAGDGTERKTVDLTGVRRLRIEASGTATDPEEDSLSAVLANAVLQGSGDDIAVLENQ